MTHENLFTTYGRVYDKIVGAKVGTPLDESEYQFINRARIRVNTEEKYAGHKIKHNLSHPEYVLFRDKVCTDNNKMDDGNN